MFSIFRLDCDETHDLRSRVWLQLTDGTYFVRPAVRENLDCCISLLREKLNVQGQPQQNLLNAHIAAPASSPRESLVPTFIPREYHRKHDPNFSASFHPDPCHRYQHSNRSMANSIGKLKRPNFPCRHWRNMWRKRTAHLPTLLKIAPLQSWKFTIMLKAMRWSDFVLNCEIVFPLCDSSSSLNFIRSKVTLKTTKNRISWTFMWANLYRPWSQPDSTRFWDWKVWGPGVICHLRIDWFLVWGQNERFTETPASIDVREIVGESVFLLTSEHDIARGEVFPKRSFPHAKVNEKYTWFEIQRFRNRKCLYQCGSIRDVDFR